MIKHRYLSVKGQPAFNVIAKKLEEGLKAVHHQDSESEKYGKLDKGPATFGVVKKLRDNDMELHTNQTVCRMQVTNPYKLSCN